MIFSFQEYQFDCQQELLSRDGKIIQLNEKSAQLLSLFLQENDKIHSKADILEKVWPNRVVTEQVVFQNISQLRALFSDGAIKTFSKKGYQWQLPITVIDQSVEAEQQPIAVSLEVENTSSKGQNKLIEQDAAPISKNRTSNSKLFIATTLVIVLILFGWLNYDNQLTQKQGLEQNNKLNAVYALTYNGTGYDNGVINGISSQILFDSPFSSWQQHAINNLQLLMATKYYSVKGKVALRFHIQGQRRGWHNYIWAENQQKAESQLNALISMLAETHYFSATEDHTAIAELTVQLARHPKNELLNVQLSNLYFAIDDMDRATAIVNQQLTEKPSLFREGLLHLLKAEITSWNRDNLAANKSANKALSIFKEFELKQLESLALIQLAWVYLVEEEFRLGMQVLNQAASKARASNEPLLEVTAHLNQSFMASKSNEVELSHTQLGLAKELIQLHSLKKEHLVKVLNNAEWIAESPEEKQAHSLEILAMPFSPQYKSYFYIAAWKVRDYYINRRQWANALNTIKEWQRPSFQALSKAHISFAQEQWRQGISHAENAFRLAQINHHKVDALDAALLIIQQQKNELNVGEYTNFITHNATNRWRAQNAIALEQLELGRD